MAYAPAGGWWDDCFQGGGESGRGGAAYSPGRGPRAGPQASFACRGREAGVQVALPTRGVGPFELAAPSGKHHACREGCPRACTGCWLPRGSTSGGAQGQQSRPCLPGVKHPSMMPPWLMREERALELMSSLAGRAGRRGRAWAGHGRGGAAGGGARAVWRFSEAGEALWWRR